MNFDLICQQLELGELLCDPVPQVGGSLHSIWYVKTSNGEFTIKALDEKNITILGDRLLSVSEYLRVGHQCDYPAGELKFIDAQSWLIKKWIPGKCLEEITVEQAKKIGKMLNNIHSKNISIKAEKPKWGPVDLEKWKTVLEKYTDDRLEKLCNSWDILSDWNMRAEWALNHFSDDFVVSHRDISVSNVVWNNDGHPTLIDWEFSGYVNRELDVFTTAINFDRHFGEVFNTIVTTYNKNLTKNFETLKSGFIGYCIDWMDFNIDRLIHYPEQKNIAIEQLQICFDGISQISARVAPRKVGQHPPQ